jgi:predicted  nucleic acid-binding Zn-ribbon protein
MKIEGAYPCKGCGKSDYTDDKEQRVYVCSACGIEYFYWEVKDEGMMNNEIEELEELDEDEEIEDEDSEIGNYEDDEII